MRKNKKIQKRSLIEQIFYGTIYILPVMLIFSYYPIISLGADETMNFEFSLPLIWLIFFDILVGILFFKNKLWKNVFLKWQWLLFPIFASLSVLWSLNPLRGILTVGILWLLYLAAFGFFELKEMFFREGFLTRWWKIFYGSGIFVCGFCLLQCILDLVGYTQDVTLMCDGCTYRMFGFPHPNGFAIEPQFMGNLLIAPTIMAAWSLLQKRQNKNLKRKSLRNFCDGLGFLSSRFLLCCFCIFTAALFLTFSRGAIYAFILAMVVLTVWEIWKTKKWRVMILWPVIILSFVFVLNIQGVFAQVSRTNDTYVDGVTKAINHLSLGVIEISTQDDEIKNDDMIIPEESELENEAMFDGYVAESTNARVRLSESALKIWSQNFRIVMFGVGIGGAGQALYQNGLSPAPKEIVQNEYASLLLEIGLVGVSLVILTVVLAVKIIRKNENKMIIVVLIIGYSITLLFFSGLANVLHIYLLISFFPIILSNFNKNSSTSTLAKV